MNWFTIGSALVVGFLVWVLVGEYRYWRARKKNPEIEKEDSRRHGRNVIVWFFVEIFATIF